MAGMVIDRFLCCTPLLHTALQALQLLHDDIWQSTGHAIVWQASVAESCPQPFPPNAADEVTLLNFFLVPPPQDLVHFVQPLQDVILQSAGQRCVLHGTYSCSAAHTPHAFCAFLTMRLRNLEPVPQLFEHDVYIHCVIVQWRGIQGVGEGVGGTNTVRRRR